MRLPITGFKTRQHSFRPFSQQGYTNGGCYPKRGIYFRNFLLKQDQRFKPSATHLYPNIGQVPTQGFSVLVTTVIAGDRHRYCLNFLKRKQPFRPGPRAFRAHAKAQNKLSQFINWSQIAATVITERVMNREHKLHAGNVLRGGQEN